MPRAAQSCLGHHVGAFALALTFFSAMPAVAQNETGLDTKPDSPPPSTTASTNNTVSRPDDPPPVTEIPSVTRQGASASGATAPPTTAKKTTARATTTKEGSATAAGNAEPTVAETSGVTVVIINSSNPTEGLPRQSVRKLFLKKIKKWDGWNQSVLPVDQRSNSEQRHQFTDVVHRMRVRSVKEYWTRMIFSGRGAPPKELGSDLAVIAFVAKNPGAIGYVSADTPLDARVKTLTISD